MIPKVIHYCWFGGNPKPELIEKCISSWRKFCPDWEIIEWTESNYDVQSYAYMKEAYDVKKWAFVSDVARLDVVAKYGGFYLDTDVELMAPIDELTENEAVYVFETERNIATGLGFGAVADHPTVTAMLNYYQDCHFLKNGKPDLTPCPACNTEMLVQVCPHFRRNGRYQMEDGVLLLGYGDYPKYMKHYGTATWGDKPKLVTSDSKWVYKDTRLKRFLKRPESFDFIEKYFGTTGVKAYTFVVYDLMERGILYFIKRSLRKWHR